MKYLWKWLTWDQNECDPGTKKLFTQTIIRANYTMNNETSPGILLIHIPKYRTVDHWRSQYVCVKVTLGLLCKQGHQSMTKPPTNIICLKINNGQKCNNFRMKQKCAQNDQQSAILNELIFCRVCTDIFLNRGVNLLKFVIFFPSILQNEHQSAPVSLSNSHHMCKYMPKHQVLSQILKILCYTFWKDFFGIWSELISKYYAVCCLKC